MKLPLKSSLLWFAGFTAVFAVAMACVFWGTWSTSVAFVQPDQMVVYRDSFLSDLWRGICGGDAFVPFDLRFLFGGPYVWQELQYAFAMYMAALGVVYYLKGRGLPPLACYGAGAAYGFMGYNFTLFSAGHLGWFMFLVYGPFAFGLIDRCVRKGRWMNWLILGGVLAWGSARQPDLWLLFTVLAFVYGLFKTACQCRESARTGLGARRAFARIARGVTLTIVALVAAGWPALHTAIFVQTANRDKQIAGTMGVNAADNGEKTPEARRAERERRYVFCTNWSLPPDELTEFAVPDVKGGSSDPRISPRNPYRGRIGMQVAPGRWSPYRQHSLYMGFLSLVFAFVGVAGLFRKRRGEEDSEVLDSRDNRAELIFWSVATLLLLLCALGGFTPFYRLVYLLPMGDYIRCPVKFVHLIEWCVAVLAGFGMARILAFRKGSRILAALVAALALANMIHLAVVDARYCAVDPADTARIAVARETGSIDIGFVMDASAQLGKPDYVLAGGTAFRDNAALKEALASGAYAPVSFWNFQFGRFVKTPRERAGFALLKAAHPAPRDATEKPSIPGVASSVSLLATAALCGLLVVKAASRGGRRI